MNSKNHARALGVDEPIKAKMGKPRCPARLRKAAATVAASALLGLAGCASPDSPAAGAWNFYNANYDRELSVATTADGKPQVSYTIKPKQQAVLSDAQVRELMAHFAAYAAQDGKAVIPAENAKLEMGNVK